jgi:hypothetical protein
MSQRRVVNLFLSRLVVLLIASGLLQANPQIEPLLDEEDYRTGIEEVLVTGTQPEWRKQKPPEWRPQVFELPVGEIKPRFEWWPKYLADERDQQDKPGGIVEGKAGFKIFEWTF